MPLQMRLLRIPDAVFSPITTALSAATMLLVIFGCMSLNTRPADENATIQQGSLSIPANSEVEVYFKVPYHHPPELVITGSHNDCVVTEQKENFFRIRNKNAKLGRSVDWEARGQAGWSFPSQIPLQPEKRAAPPQEGQAAPSPPTLSPPSLKEAGAAGG